MLQIKYQLTYLCMQELLVMTHKKRKYDDNSRQTEGNKRTQQKLNENNNFLLNISFCNSTNNLKPNQ